jgi:hypothetical protein
MGSLGTLGRLPLDVRRLVYSLAALYLSRTCRRIREESRPDFLEQCKSVPICGKEMQRYVRYVTSAGLARSILVIPLTGVRGATVLDLQHDQSAHQSALEYLEGKEEVVSDCTSSLLVYRRRGSGGDVRRSAVVTCERVMRRQLEVLVRGLYCTLEDLVGCRLVPGTLTVDEGRPLSEDEKVAAERRILSHFRMGDDWHRRTWGTWGGEIPTVEVVTERLRVHEADQERICAALEAGREVPSAGRYLAYRSMEDVRRAHEALDVIRMACRTPLERTLRFRNLGSRCGWVNGMQASFAEMWQELSTRVSVPPGRHSVLFWRAYEGTRDVVAEGMEEVD